MTVSYVLRGLQGNFRPGTRDRVLAAAAALGYRGSVLPEAMRSGTFNMVALVVSDTGSPGWVSGLMLDAIHDALHLGGKHLLYCKIHDHDLVPERENEAAPRLFRHTHADGVLVNGLSDAAHDRIQAALGHYPLVHLNAHRSHDAVYPDDFHAGQCAGQYFLGSGCRRPAYLSFFIHGHSSMRLRQAGFASVCAERDLISWAPVDDTVGIEQRAAWVQRLLDQSPDGIFCYCSTEAIELCRHLDARGWGPDRRPRIMVVAEELFLHQSQPVPTLLLPMAQLGQHGANMLLRKLDGDRAPQSSMALPLELVGVAENAQPR